MSKRECRKCGDHIPNWVKIDGKNRNLKGRKFCLKCSPFRSHNTKSDDPSRPSKKKVPYSCWSEEAKQKGRENIYKRGWTRKKEIVSLAGGECQRCGYNKNIKVLTFHHRDPSQKIFGLSVNNLWSKKWEVILEEFKKCDMYCQNCHMEIHDEINMANPNYYRNIFNF
jgi:hypothetical protein